MLSFFKKYKVFFISLACLSVIILVLFYTALKPKKHLKVYSPADVNPELVDSTIQYVSPCRLKTPSAILSGMISAMRMV